MDSHWIKQRLRMAGKNSSDLAEAIGRDRAVISRIMNGHQAMTLDQARVIAEVLGVDISEVLTRSGLAGPQTAQAFQPGFAESDAAAWIPGPGMDESGNVRSIAQVLGADRPGVDVWRVKSRAMALAGYLEGDFMLVDTHAAERARAGDVVIAQIYTRTSATTVLRRFEPPVLVAASADPEEGRVRVVDGTNVVIMGKIVASWRM